MLVERDQDILSSLSLHVRLFSLHQIAGYWWSHSTSAPATARRRLSRLVDSGHLKRYRFPVRPLPPLLEPLFVWRPPLPPPDPDALSWKLQSRWTAPPKPTTVYTVTQRAANFFGGRARSHLKRSAQAGHDLGLSAVYLRFREQRPDQAARWIGEDLIAPYRKRQKLPDAVIAASPEDMPELIVEFGGAYGPDRVRAFHIDCKRRRIPYELW